MTLAERLAERALAPFRAALQQQYHERSVSLDEQYHERLSALLEQFDERMGALVAREAAVVAHEASVSTREDQVGAREARVDDLLVTLRGDVLATNQRIDVLEERLDAGSVTEVSPGEGTP